jgi:hypothetical protein
MLASSVSILEEPLRHPLVVALTGGDQLDLGPHFQRADHQLDLMKFRTVSGDRVRRRRRADHAP